MYRVMIVEDDAGIAGAIDELCRSWGLATHVVGDLTAVMAEFESFDPQLVMLDIVLPFYNGYYWCEQIRRVSRVPIIFISSASDNMNIVMAMNMGGDDFISKPFDGEVLMAKVQATLRRTYDFALTAPTLTHRGAALSSGDCALFYGGERVELTKNELRILTALFEADGKVVSRERLMELLWKTDSFIDDNTLTVNVNRLRRKLSNIGLNDFILTKVGVGYMLG